MFNYDYKKTIEETYQRIRRAREGKQLRDDKTAVQVLRIFHSAIHAQIHAVLVPKKSREGEWQIREIIRRYVIGGEKWVGALTIIEEKMRECQRNGAPHEVMSQYYELYDDFYALAAFRSLKHYALYIEFDKPKQEKIWANTMNCFSGLWYYANKMILDGEVKVITKQMPTGYGKSYSDNVLISWALGQNINNDILKAVGMPVIVPDIMTQIVNIMTSARYAKVFPYFEQFERNRDKMFYVCQIRQGELLINGTNRSKNLLVFSKHTEVSGSRARFFFFDDITCAKDAGNDREHEKDWRQYITAWVKRNYNLNDFYMVAGGTAYSLYDFLSKFKELHNFEHAVKSGVNRYTKIANNGKNVFVIVPLLDYETDRSTYNSKFPTADAKADRERNYEVFMAMCQQTPLPPEGNPYYWDKLKQYDRLPPKESQGGIRSDYCKASIDLARKGQNYTTCMIFSQCQENWYYTDCVYQKAPIDEKDANGIDVLDRIIDKVITHNVNEIIVEENTNSSIKTMITDRLKQRNYSCTVTTLYSTENKEARIHNEQGKILDRIIFPSRKLYAESSEMGKSMRHIVTYAYDGKNDDAIDTIANFSKKVINTQARCTEVQLIYRR